MNVLMKAARVVGDLDDEFYADERQRDVWNEAAAIGFQLWLWSALVVAAILPWVAGTVGAWTAVGLLVAAAVISLVTQWYSRAHDVDLHVVTRQWFQPRTVLFTVVYLAAVLGIAWQLAAKELITHGFLVGGVCGGIAGAGAAWFAVRRARTKALARDRAEEQRELDGDL